MLPREALSMSTLYVDRRGLELRLQAGALELRAEGERMRSMPAALIERVVLRAETRLTSTTLAALAEAGVGVVALGGRGGQRVAHLLGAPASDARARIAQCQRVNDETWAGAWAGQVVRAKLRGQQRLLGRARDARPDLRKPLSDALVTLEGVLARAACSHDRAALRGFEGAGAAAYFRGYATLFADSLGFNGRRRRPPPDPVNACLSLGYTLLHAQAVQACWAAGLDPMVGFLHLPAFGRESLACDLVEPWRVQVDHWVWQQFRERLFRPEHFGRDGGGACVIGKAARSHYYAAFTPVQRRLGAALRRHARLAARALAGLAAMPPQDLLHDALMDPRADAPQHAEDHRARELRP
jgi:CRISPR-associated protein Cas1